MIKESALGVVLGVLVAVGLVARPFSASAADLLWLAAVVTAAVPATVWVLADLRKRRYGADLLAVLALVGAAAA